MEHFSLDLREDSGFSHAAWAQNFLKAPLRGAEALRAICVASRPGPTVAQQQPVGPKTAQRTPPERAARDESGRAPPSRPERRS